MNHDPAELDDPNSPLRCAYHEAGHAVVHLAGGYELQSVSIIPPEPGKLGFTGGTIAPERFNDIEHWDTLSPEDQAIARDHLVCLAAGDIAEARLRHRPFEADHYRMDTSDECALGGALVRFSRDSERQNHIYTETVRAAEQLIDDHWPAVDAIATALLRHGSINAAEALTRFTKASARASQ